MDGNQQQLFHTDYIYSLYNPQSFDRLLMICVTQQLQLQ